MDVIQDEANMKTEPDPLTDLEREMFPNLIMLRKPKIEEIEEAEACPIDGSEETMPCIDGVNTDVVKQEPVSDEEMSAVSSVNEAVDMMYEECDIPIPFPVVVIEDEPTVHKVKEEADGSDASSTSSLEDEYIVGIKYESHHERVISTESREEALGHAASGNGAASDVENLCVEG